MSMIEKWKRAVIHLECATDSEHFSERFRRIIEQRRLLDQGKISLEEFAKQIGGGSRDIRYHGTALFLVHDNRRYLLTARHVVWDELSAKRELQEEAQRVQSWSEDMRQDLLRSFAERAQNRIFNIIFRVPSIDEILAKREQREFLMNLGAGTSFTVPYTFDTQVDLALISLDQRDSRFADELSALGFIPIDSSAISDGPDSEGQEVFTIGFPSSTALLGQVSQHPALTHWASSYFSLPVSSFGRVSMLHHALPFFWADMSIYPGNSGGPVIADDLLIGIVSAQAMLPTDDAPAIRTRIPFGRIIKTSYVRALLEAQVKKDEL